MTFLTREQLEDRLAALHQASLELVRDLSLDKVLERIVSLARQQADASYAALGVLDEDGELVQFIPVGMTQEEIEQTGTPPIGKGLIGAIKNEARTLRIANVESNYRSAGFPSGHPKMDSFLGVPIKSGDRILGQIYLTNKQGAAEFTADDERVIETLAAYAAVAINNARLYEGMLSRDQALRRRNEDLALINDVAAALTGSLDVDDILEKTLDRVMSYLGMEAGEIFLRGENSKELHMALHRGEFAQAFLTRERFKVGEGFIGITAETGQPMVSTDLRKEVRYLRPAVVEAGFCCIASIPLSASGEAIGVMSVATRQPRELNDREINLLVAIGGWAGITIENARLHNQARRLAVMEERERIGMDLHDGIIQSIYAVGLALDYARMSIEEAPSQSREKIDQAIDGLNTAIRDIRSYILDLRPRQFAGKNLMDGLRRLVEEYRANTLAEASVVGPDNGLVNMPSSQATALFHICQEALANAAKHSGAKRTDVRLWTTKDRILLEVADDGKGFDVSKVSITLGHGLSNMHIRARKVGGDVEINSEPGEGATVLAWVPRRS